MENIPWSCNAAHTRTSINLSLSITVFPLSPCGPHLLPCLLVHTSYRSVFLPRGGRVSALPAPPAADARGSPHAGQWVPRHIVLWTTACGDTWHFPPVTT